jgi:two-component system, OmpR family, phosphate regulon sensor histidine kinase PhoR
MADAMTQEGEALRRTGTRLPKPLVRQLLLVVPLLLDLLVVLVGGGASSLGGYYTAGMLLVLAATALTALDPVRPLPARLVALLPVVDLAAIGLMRLVPEENGLGILAILPAMWLAADHRMKGVGITVAGTLALVSLPSFLYFGISETAVWSRALLVPMIAFMCAVTVAGTGQVWLRQNRELEVQGEQLTRALAEVTANQALNDAIVTTVDVGLVALDRDGAYEAVNPRQLDFMELAFPDGHHGMAGQDGYVYAADRCTPLSREDMPTVRAMRGETFDDCVIWVGRDAARQKALSVSARPVRDAAGELDGAVLAYKDITELMSALTVKDEFVASVSHELRTPLTSILGYLEMVLEDKPLDPGVRQQLDIVKRNSERLLRLVSDLLFTAQVDEGQLGVEVVRVDVSCLVGQAVAELTATAEVTVHQAIEPSLVIRADPTRLRQMLDNLVTNAVKYTAPGGKVTVRLEGDAEDVVLTVCDTGMGIAQEDLDRLFTRFFRTRDAESRAIQGIGLGLAITKSIVEAHGGRIEVQSEVGRGSSFVVRLPRSGPAMKPHAVPSGSGVPSVGRGTASRTGSRSSRSPAPRG